MIKTVHDVKGAHCYQCRKPQRFERSSNEQFHCPNNHPRIIEEHLQVPLDVQDRFWERVKKTPTCWLWTGRRDPKEYGHYRLWVDGRLYRVQVVSWWIHTGVLPKPGNWLVRICYQQACVNPEHIAEVDLPGSIQIRLKRGTFKIKRKQVCKQGHRFTPANTINTTYSGRICRICRNDRQRRYMRRRKEGLVLGQKVMA